jgi:hypothetical protein
MVRQNGDLRAPEEVTVSTITNSGDSKAPEITVTAVAKSREI